MFRNMFEKMVMPQSKGKADMCRLPEERAPQRMAVRITRFIRKHIWILTVVVVSFLSGAGFVALFK